MGENSKSILFVKNVPLNWSFDIIFEKFNKYGEVKEIRNGLGERNKSFETWISFKSAGDAMRALNEFALANNNMSCSLVDGFPLFLDIYRPPNQTEKTNEDTILRSPDPASWLIVTTGERGNLFKMKKFINQRLGLINRPDIKRFGRNSFLVHAKSDGQAAMLLNMAKDSEGMIKAIKPHYTFSYARGVIFNEDVHDLPEEEILEMCPDNVWKIFKVPRSSMIVITFVNDILPTEIVLDKEFMRVRPYRPRVLQCFNCYQFGHAKRVCVASKICQHCSQPEHGEECNRSKMCVNCKGSHHARDKTCKVLVREEEALLKSIDEHISVGHAKKLLAKKSYSDIVKGSKPSHPTTDGNNPANAGVSGFSFNGAHGSSGVDPRASSGVDPRASSGGTPRASSGGAPWASSGGALPASSGAGKNNIEPKSTKKAHDNSLFKKIQSGAGDIVSSGTQSGSICDLDSFSLPDIFSGGGNFSETITSSPIVTVHRSDDGEEMESLTVGNKRARPPSPCSSHISRHEKSSRKDRYTDVDQALEKTSLEKKSRSKSLEKLPSNKLSLSRPVINRPGEPNKIPKPK